MPFRVVSEVGRGIGVLNGGGDRRRERGSFGGKCGPSHCNQWGLCGVVILCRTGGDAALPKLLWDFLLIQRGNSAINDHNRGNITTLQLCASVSESSLPHNLRTLKLGITDSSSMASGIPRQSAGLLPWKLILDSLIDQHIALQLESFVSSYAVL